MLSKIFNLQLRNSKEIISLLYKVVIIPILYNSYIIAKLLYINNTYQKTISLTKNGQRLFTDKLVNNLPLGIIGGIVSFIILITIWKLFCELLIILFCYFESNTKCSGEK